MIGRRLVLVVLGVLFAAAACGDADGADGADGAETAGDEPAPTSATTADPDATVAPSTTTTTIPTSVSGDPLAPLPESGVEPVGGLPAPTFEGTDILTGEVVSLAPTGRPTAIAFFAHWCPHCQREVQEITDWLAANDFPDTVDFVAVSTLEDPARDNHPPSEWLEGEGWPYPVISDTADFAVATAYGVTAVPFWAFLDGEGQVLTRVAGNLGPDLLAQLFEDIATGP